MNKRISVLIVLLGGMSFGVLSTIVKKSYDAGMNLGQVSVAQALLGALLLWAFILFKKLSDKEYKLNFTKKEAITLMVSGISTACTSIVYYKSLQYLSASMAILLLFQFTWIGNIIECILDRKLMEKKKVIALVILIGGTLLASNVLIDGFNINPMGLLFGILAALCYCVFMYVNGKVVTNVNPIQRSAWMITGATIFLTIVFYKSLFTGNASLFVEFEYGIPLALFGNVIPPVFFSIGVPIVGIGLSSILGSIELPVATLCSVIVLHEQTSLIRWVGIILILTAIIIPVALEKNKK
ncbi:Threonine/homoserine efflux transporter RhtA [Cetobacterium ceti]|uniref:Threonine/homoserine efflux transporter RhtA n=1 Tax=Cetobacterium ceti TaxID=180163 RepID=A0A1T4KSG0_9FUSO|nr:DMT family transporter [Cetobacterium ceti]SJZ45313.1 Threonine/homoserine efflux transporter RhtA [Cetobacterium ceti]